MEKFKGMIFLTGAFTLAGSSVISARFVSEKLGIFTITSISLLFAVIGLFPFCHSNITKYLKLINKRDWFMLTLQALFGIFLFRLFLLQGLLHTSTGEAGVMTGATPAFTAIMAIVLLKEAMRIKSISGLVSTVAGIMLIQGILLPGSEFSYEHLLGNTLVLCAALSESIFNISSRFNSFTAASSEGHTPNPIAQTAIVSGIALFLCLIPASFEKPLIAVLSLGLKEWLALVWYGLFVTALAFIFWYAGIKRCNASTAAAFSGLMPFTSMVLSVTLLGEPILWQQWSGGLLVILGMLLIGNSN